MVNTGFTENYTEVNRLVHTYSILGLLFALCFGVSSNTLHAQSFNSTGLSGENINNPTSLQFGPDDRLYVSQQDGTILAFTVSQSGSNYNVTATETINVIKQVLNHQDFNGQIFPGAVSRQITGILVTGTANTPILYVTSSDYRIGGGGGGADLDLDTNSGMIHKLTKTNNGWQRLDLVRGLPRSEENHASNGMQIDGNILYVAQGGHTNAGAPSNNFAFTTEYAYSAAVLTVDLAAIEAMTTKTWGEDGSLYKYDLPTLDDPSRPNTGPGGADVGDPFGGNDGLNQAKITANSPVQVYAPGFRNLYDLVLTESGHLYGWDNGPNGGWGGHPANEGAGTATNNWLSGEPGSTGPGPNDLQVNNQDGLHFITGQGYYGGHPNPIRANPNGAGLFVQSGNGGGNAGVWRTNTGGANPLPNDWPPVPSSLANPIEGDYQNPGVDDPSVFTVQASTNGMCEYTSNANGGALQGDILAASFNGKLYRIQRNNNGTISGAASVSTLAENFGSIPLDVTAQGDNDVFPGTIWAATYGADNITIFTPTAGPANGCQNVNSSSLDNDNDGFTNADETQNGTDPCSQASTPPDADGSLINGFKVSDLNDPDDDDDGLTDSVDAFALDASNGQNTVLPLDLPLLNGDPGTGFFGVGFTGLMTNGQDYLLNIADENNSTTEIIAGGAVGLFTINNQGGGDPFNAFNSLKNGFQLGFPLTQSSPITTLETKLLGPLWTGTPQNFQQAGIVLSDGSQINYLKLVPIHTGNFAVQVQYQEDDATVISNNFTVAGIQNASEVNLYLEIDPTAGTVQPSIDIGNGRQSLGTPIQLQGNLLARVQGTLAPAVGILVSSGGASTMNATYDYIRINQATNTSTGSWTTIDGNGGCNPTGQPGSCAQGRHEASYVQVGRKFYLLGGREHGSNVNIYDPATDTWTIGSDPGFPVHHFQAVALDGLIYAIGIFEDNNFPNEQPYDRVLIYDPARDRWFDGPAIPSARIRGSAGCVARNGKLYLVGGITNGHSSGWSNKFDEYDPATGQWTILPNVPRARDHFHAAIDGDRLYVAGGRRSGQTSTFLPTIAAVDMYDFNTGSWTRLPNNLPTPRAAPAVGVLNGELIVAGGERNTGLANDDVHALNLSTNEWRTLAPLNQGRHGTQAIVNNGAIYVASGSPNQGGGSTQTQERFTFNGGNPSVTGTVLAQAQVSSPSGKTWNNVANGQNANESITLSHNGGNQGAVIEQVSISGNGFSIVGGASALLGRLIRPSAAISFNVNYARSSNAAASGALTIRTSASGQNITVALNAPSLGSTGGGGSSVFINAAGPAVTTGGQAYIADQYFTTPSNLSQRSGVAVAGTTRDILYNTHRWRNGNFGYDIPVSNGSYDVTLRFAETFFSTAGGGANGPGQRIFHVNIEGQRVLTNFDVNAISGSINPTAVDRNFTVTVNNGVLDIDFIQGSANNPFISAIEIVPSSGTPPNGPSMNLNPTSIAFQTQAINTTSNAVSVTVSNSGDESATVNSISIAGAQASAFASTDLSGGNTIAAGASRTFQVTFRPSSTQPAAQQAQLTVNFNGSVPDLTMNLTGEAEQPSGGGGGGGGTGSGADLELSASATNNAIGQWQVGGGRFTLSNTGTASASGVVVMLRLPTGYVYEGGNEAMVSQGSFDPYQGGEWTIGTVAAGASVTIDYRVFNPLTTAAKVDAWVSAQNGTDQDSSPSANPDGEDDATCYEFNGSGACDAGTGGGGGTTPTPADLSINPASINFPNTQGGQTVSRSVTITNTGGTAATVASRGYIGTNPGQFSFNGLTASATIAAGGTETFNLVFRPGSTASGTKNATFRIQFANGVSTINIPVTGTITAPSGGGGGSNNPDLELAITSTSPNPNIWTTFNATVTITNSGGASVSGVSMQMALPPDMVFVGGNEATSSQGSFNPYSAPQTWTIGTLAAGASATLDANLFYMTTAPRRLTAWVSAQNGTDADSQAGNGFGNGEDDEACFEFRGGGACSSSSALVVAPTNFNASVRNMEVETYWNVDQGDRSTRDYVVERSTTNNNWEMIGTALPTADPTLHVWDAAPAFGLNRYRLSTRNADGSIREQSIREVSFDVDASVMQVYPNPASDHLTIFTPTSDVYEMEVKIYNALGQQMNVYKFDRAATQEIELGANWPGGFYQVQVRVGGVRKAFGVQVVR